MVFPNPPTGERRRSEHASLKETRDMDTSTEMPPVLSTRLSVAATAVSLIGWLGTLFPVFIIWATLTDGYPLWERLREAPLVLLSALVIPFALLRAGYELRLRQRRGALLAVPALLIGPVPILFADNSWGGYSLVLPLVALLIISAWRELR
jgi:hypothetical protein